MYTVVNMKEMVTQEKIRCNRYTVKGTAAVSGQGLSSKARG